MIAPAQPAAAKVQTALPLSQSFAVGCGGYGILPLDAGVQVSTGLIGARQVRSAPPKVCVWGRAGHRGRPHTPCAYLTSILRLCF